MTDKISKKLGPALLSHHEVAKILNKTTTQLTNTIKFFDAHDDDEWELQEGEHFEFLIKSGPLHLRPRRFTEEAVAILARYYEEKGEINFVNRVLDALLRRRLKRKKMLVSRKIVKQFVSSEVPLEIRGEFAFVTKKTTINILETNGKGFNNSEQRLINSGSLDGQEGLEIDKDFIRSEETEERMWSQRGIARLAIDMSQNSRIKKSRKVWVETVGDVVEDCFKQEIKRLNAASNRIDKIISNAKKATNYTCQVSGKKKNNVNSVQLIGHHLFDRHTRPDLADLQENILVVENQIHIQFHAWKGGESCEPKDFLKFLLDVRFDLIDPDNSVASKKRYQYLLTWLEKLQKNYEKSYLKN
ncbi:hypothetical protein [Prochlorococcus marinus]|uniref:hypothetical protein n=1 Tax=Prochlorococcus marinus TaxID=1219 RepID=UPI0022B39CEB|nr:hypothetical protein [Prochlorococcus marinus]